MNISDPSASLKILSTHSIHIRTVLNTEYMRNPDIIYVPKMEFGLNSYLSYAYTPQAFFEIPPSASVVLFVTKFVI
jgi:hypothetical protein